MCASRLGFGHELLKDINCFCNLGWVPQLEFGPVMKMLRVELAAQALNGGRHGEAKVSFLLQGVCIQSAYY